MSDESNQTEPEASATPPPPAPAPPAPAPASTSSAGMTANTWAMICHLSGLIGLLLPVAGNIGGPLVVWLLKKDELPEVDRHGKEALNFQISYMIYSAVIGTLAAILFVIVIGIFLLPLVFVVYLLTIIFPIIAGLKANEGGVVQLPNDDSFFQIGASWN